jgi:hypothetical protein
MSHNKQQKACMKSIKLEWSPESWTPFSLYFIPSFVVKSRDLEFYVHKKDKNLDK